MTDSYQKRRAKVNVCAELRRRGWTIYGFKQDESDLQSDYWSPADWEGVAEKDGFVVCVDVADYTVQRYSGGHKTVRYVPDKPCDHCKGKGTEPNGWTLEQARANPVEWRNRRLGRTAPGAISSDVVSPVPFRNGIESCIVCNGRSHTLRTESVVVPWPHFSANPKGCKWHVEKDGKILAKGTGLGACQNINGHLPEKRQEVAAAVKALVDRIETPWKSRLAPASGHVHGSGKLA